MIRRAEGDADLERCVEIFNAVHPKHPIGIDDLRGDHGPTFLHDDGGSVYIADSSPSGWAYTMVRVRPDARGRGIGSALLEVAFDQARKSGMAGNLGHADPAGDYSRAWLAARGFVETLQDVELLREVQPGDGEVAEGIVALAPEYVDGAYTVEAECIPDVPATVPGLPWTFERWRAAVEKHAATFVALDGGRVVGFATLEHLHGTPHRLQHGLTAVLRSHRGRGIATQLKQSEIAWAAANGYRELITYTDTTNLAMRRVNAKLGYAETLGPIVVERAL